MNNTDLDNRDCRTTEDVPPITSVSVLIGRLMWFAIGPAILMFVTYGIVTGGSGWFTVLDATFFVVVGLMIWVLANVVGNHVLQS